MATWSSPISKLMCTEPTSNGWHSGMTSLVRLAACMPATRATASTSPLFTSRLAMAAVVSAAMKTLHRATARRCVGSFGVTSTMRARPIGSRWEKARSLIWSPTLLIPAVPRSTRRSAGLHGPGVDHFEGGARYGFQLVQVVVVPPRIRRSLEEPVAAVVGDDQSVALHRRGNDPRLTSQRVDIEVGAQPEPHAHGGQRRIGIARGEMGCRQDVAALG